MITRPPSKVHDDYWVHVENPLSPHDWTNRCGKWLIFTSFKKVDEAWRRIAEETAIGRLGIAAKAATAKRNELAKNPWIKVICVYTYDSLDVEDVMRVRQRLREMGYEKKLSYKTDEATQEGIYANNSSIPVSLYYE